MSSDHATNKCKATNNNMESVIHGVVFGRSVRAFFAIIHLADEQENHVVVRLQFLEDQHAKYLRSWCRRSCKFGDYIRVRGSWGNSHSESSMGQPRFIVNIKTPQNAISGDFLRVEEAMRCDVKQCQVWQNKYCKFIDNTDPSSFSEGKPKPKQKQKKIIHKTKIQGGVDDDDTSSRSYRHGGGLGKRIQGEYVRNFLMNMIHDPSGSQSDPTSWATTVILSENLDSYNQVVQILNQGSGVIDAAGGSGHVSMALGLAGIQSTIVDPRKSVGKLPGRDRKIWYRALKKETNILGLVDGKSNDAATLQCGVCAKVVPFSIMKAWFANRPDGVDPSFRHPDEQEVPVCANGSDLLDNCSAIVALHPDEATDAIVDMAVKKQIPFVVVPCCVFSRLFPHRRKPNGEQVSTYMDLLEYLCAKHENIRKTKMPFDGANYLLWGTF